MLTFPWPTLNRWPPLPAHTRRLVEAVRSGRGGELFSPCSGAAPEGVELDAWRGARVTLDVAALGAA